MNTEEAYSKLLGMIVYHGPEEIMKRLGPAGTPPEPCWAARGAGPQEGDPLTPPRTARWADQATGELQRLVDYLESEADKLWKSAELAERKGKYRRVVRIARKAGELSTWAMYVRGVCSEPRAQSDSEQRCPECDGTGWHSTGPHPGFQGHLCQRCEGTGVSGACPPNDQ